MEQLVIGKSLRSILLQDFFSVVIETGLKIGLSDQEDSAIPSIDRINLMTGAFLQANDLLPDHDIRTLNHEKIENISESSIKEIFDNGLGEGDFPRFKMNFLNEILNDFDLIQQFGGGKAIEAGVQKKETAIMLRMFFEFYRRIMEIVENKENTKSYLHGLKMASSLNVPTTYEEYEQIAQSYHVLVTIEKGIERLNIPDDIIESEIMPYYVYFPDKNNIEKEIDLFMEMGLPISELETKILKLKRKYLSFDLVANFTNPSYTQDLINVLCSSDLYRENVRSIITDWYSLIETKKKEFEAFFDKVLTEIYTKKIGFSEKIVSIIGHMINLIDEKKKEEDIADQLAKIFTSIYKNTINDYYLDIDLKMKQLKEISEKKKELCAINRIQELKTSYQSLTGKTIDLEKLFFQNYYPKRPIKYFFLLHIAYRQFNLDFIQKVLRKKEENRILRNYARDLVYKQLVDNRNINNLEKIKRTKEVFREYFELLERENEKIEYKKEMLKYLISLITQNQEPPYPNFYPEIADLFISIINRILDPNIFSKKLGGKILKPLEKDNLELCTFYIEEELHQMMMTQLEEAGLSKESIKKKINLRFGNEYKIIEDKYYRMEKKLI